VYVPCLNEGRRTAATHGASALVLMCGGEHAEIHTFVTYRACPLLNKVRERLSRSWTSRPAINGDLMPCLRRASECGMFEARTCFGGRISRAGSNPVDYERGVFGRTMPSAATRSQCVVPA